MRLSRVLVFRSFGLAASPSRILYFVVSNLRTLSLIFPPPFSFSCSPSLPRLPLSSPPFRSHGLHKAPHPRVGEGTCSVTPCIFRPKSRSPTPALKTVPFLGIGPLTTCGAAREGGLRKAAGSAQSQGQGHTPRLYGPSRARLRGRGAHAHVPGLPRPGWEGCPGTA